MSRILYFLLIFYSGLILADDLQKSLAGFDPRVDTIAENYEAGQYLLYDCVEGHWTCVTEPYFVECEAKRNEDILARKIESRCAPLGSMPTKKSCFQRQLFLTSNNHGHKFCVLPEWKEKGIIYDFQK